MEPVRVLFLGASPDDFSRIDFEREEQELRASIQGASSIDVHPEYGIHPRDLSSKLRVHAPHIVHFSAPVTPKGLVLESDDGKSAEVSAEWLSGCFRELEHDVRIVIFNSRDGIDLAEAVSRHVECVIALADSPGNGPARAFSASFYKALASSSSIGQALRDANSSIALDYDDVEYALVCYGDADPGNIILIPPAEPSDSEVRGVEPIRVLFLSASPDDRPRVPAYREAKRIRASAPSAGYPSRLEVVTEYCVQPNQLSLALSRHKPHIVHFCTHCEQGQIVLEAEDGAGSLVSGELLAERLSSHNVKLVVFSSAESEALAKIACNYVDCAIGTRADLDERIYQSFSSAFYQVLAAGRSVADAFRDTELTVGPLACKSGASSDKRHVLHCRHGVDPSKLVLLPGGAGRGQRAQAESRPGRAGRSQAADRPSGQNRPSGQRWALIIGISEYRHKAWNLRFAHRDAQELYNLIRTPAGGGFDEDKIRKLINEEASGEAVRTALFDFLKKPAPEDLVLIYFACHGFPDEEEPDDVYLLAHDTKPASIAGTGVSMREVQRALERLKAKKVVVFADTCHSASLGGSIGRRGKGSPVQLMRYLEEVKRAESGMALLMSAEANESAQEHERWGGGHGVFTHYLLEGIRTGKADKNGNGVVSVGELFDYIRENVKKATYDEQNPVIGTTRYDRKLPIAVLGRLSPPRGNRAAVDSEPSQDSDV